MAIKLAKRDSETGPRFDTIALSGGCFHNRILLEEVLRRLEVQGFNVLTHSNVPAGDGGLALGQAAIAAAILIDEEKKKTTGGNAPCASAFPAAS
jgi:hydrogenase maturation protein HypF